MNPFPRFYRRTLKFIEAARHFLCVQCSPAAHLPGTLHTPLITIICVRLRVCGGRTSPISLIFRTCINCQHKRINHKRSTHTRAHTFMRNERHYQLFMRAHKFIFGSVQFGAFTYFSITIIIFLCSSSEYFGKSLEWNSLRDVKRISIPKCCWWIIFSCVWWYKLMRKFIRPFTNKTQCNINKFLANKIFVARINFHTPSSLTNDRFYSLNRLSFLWIGLANSGHIAKSAKSPFAHTDTHVSGRAYDKLKNKVAKKHTRTHSTAQEENSQKAKQIKNIVGFYLFERIK